MSHYKMYAVTVFIIAPISESLMQINTQIYLHATSQLYIKLDFVCFGDWN